jgi:hypothetical protein
MDELIVNGNYDKIAKLIELDKSINITYYLEKYPNDKELLKIAKGKELMDNIMDIFALPIHSVPTPFERLQDQVHNLQKIVEKLEERLQKIENLPH